MLLRRYKKYIFIMAIVSFASFLIVHNAKAQSRVKFTTTEDVAIAFYKTGGTIPNFENWVKKREPYSTTPWARREALMQTELTRLNNAYLNFNPKEDLLVIRTFVRMEPSETMDDEGLKTHHLNAEFMNAPDAMYFPYDFLDERFIVMPHKLDLIMKSKISESDYNSLKTNLPQSSRNTMIVKLRVTEADTNQPYMIDGLEQWVLKAEIATVEIWSPRRTLLWEYSAPWYLSPNTKVLNNLYEKGPIFSPEKGIIKPLPLEYK
jgi:hypothetical protein